MYKNVLAYYILTFISGVILGSRKYSVPISNEILVNTVPCIPEALDYPFPPSSSYDDTPWTNFRYYRSAVGNCNFNVSKYARGHQRNVNNNCRQ